MNIKPFILLASLGLMASCDTKKEEGSDQDQDTTVVAEASLEQIWSYRYDAHDARIGAV